MTLALHTFPRCAGYLAAMNVKPERDPGMTDYWCAVLIADAFEDDELVDAGTVNFETMTGEQLLGAFEAMFRDPSYQSKKDKKASSRGELSGVDFEQFKAFFGCRGLKAARMSTDDFWRAASILWPSVVKKGQRGPVHELHATISGMNGKRRRSEAAANLARITKAFAGHKASKQ